MGYSIEEKSKMNALAVLAGEEAQRNVDLMVPSLTAKCLLQLLASTQDGRHILQGGKDVRWYKHGLWTCTGVLTHAKIGLAKNRHNVLLG